MKNILILTSSLCIGGAERVIANLARHIDRNLFNLTICHLKERGEIGDELVENGIRVVGIPQETSKYGRYLTFRHVRRIVLEHNIDLLHTHTTYSLVDGALVRLRGTRAKMVHTFHFGNYPKYVKRYMWMERLFGRIPDRLVAVGVEQKEAIKATYGFANDRMVTISNGVEPVRASIDPLWKGKLADIGRPLIGTICTLTEQKGLGYFLEVAKKMVDQGSDAYFVIVGDGNLRTYLEDRCRQLRLDDRIVFTGWMKNATSAILPLFDVFVQSSLWEAMSMAVLEAMAAARPVVVTDVGDNRHVVMDGHTGFVVPPKNVDTMVHAINRLMQSPAQRKQLGEAGLRRFEENYSASVMTRRYQELYREVLAG